MFYYIQIFLCAKASVTSRESVTHMISVTTACLFTLFVNAFSVKVCVCWLQMLYKGLCYGHVKYDSLGMGFKLT